MNHPSAIVGMKTALDMIRTLRLTPELRKKVMSRSIREVLKHTRRNIRRQETPEGVAWPERSAVTNKKGPMLKRLARGRVIRAWYGEYEARLDYPNSGVSKVAAKHQYGKRESVMRPVYPKTFDTSKVPTWLNHKQEVRPDGKWCCTANQAAMLIRLDYLPPWLRHGVPSGATAAIRYVMQQVSRGQAAFLIREGLKHCPLANVPVVTPARPFLGATEEDESIIVNFVIATIHEQWPKGRKRQTA